MPTQTKQPPTDAKRLLGQVSFGFVASSALNAMARLNVADALANGPLTITELASKVGCHADSLQRALRLLTSLGIFEENAQGKFSNNEASTALRSDVPDSERDMVAFLADPFHFTVYADMVPTLKDGKTGTWHALGKDCFDAFEGQPEEQKAFDDAMTNISKKAVPAVLEAYDFSQFDTLVDVAGGHGYLLTGILQKNPNLKGVLFDMAHVVSGGQKRIDALNLSQRCTTVSGDFFKEVPAGDAYIMKHIIHDWDDERAIKILKNCRRALTKKDGKLLLVEFLLAEPNQPCPSRFMDIEMLMMPGGRERNKEEYAKLFEQSGFKLARVIETKSLFFVIEAEAV